MRKAFRMQVNRGRYAAYERRHNPIRVELRRELKRHGVSNYSIFLDPATGDLFGYVEIEDEKRWERIARTKACRRWWKYMRGIMPSNPDNSPKSRELREVFHLA